MRISLDFHTESIIVVLFFVHLILGGIRGLYRYRMIEKYQYNYYADPPMNIFGKLAHNWLAGTFSSTTFFLSASITVMLFLFF
ncbi:hypothetical protein [Flagellimonas allohymeniacidonis]|uniref:Uncharacterized protein n=1 Tax=Flagellimonas allohymeniacidonis TaxID=2517819 RepID=A0A4Q8QCU4_9FLAO|nr:hypothetical protein [Allomuricauda hymeniacidonis]TAI47297.1 hypothetical protein EW142_11485 [Allomuricauda hymeniacidonis]